jgi:ribosomal protein S18 acetylase RimI-like enzyme
MVASTRWDSETVRGLQERAARGLPAEHVEQVGDWWLRRSATSSWWMATVLPHGAADRTELERRIGIAERFYAGSGLATRFQVCPAVCPAELDTRLAERGYRRESPMSLQVAAAADVRTLATGGLSLRLGAAPTTEWFEVWYAVHGNGSDPRAEWDMLARVTRPSAYARAVDGDQVVAVGRAVADTGWAGVFGMATLPGARGRGAGRGILRALAEWAIGEGADGLYLQVETDNDAALRLYNRAGFTEVAGYHYRSGSRAGPFDADAADEYGDRTAIMEA